jgi:hypothetical protein
MEEYEVNPKILFELQHVIPARLCSHQSVATPVSFQFVANKHKIIVSRTIE